MSPDPKPMQVEHQSEPTTTRQAPPPLKGPIKTRAALRAACSEFVSELHACDDMDALDAFLALPASAALIAQVEDEHELFWKGDGADFLGMEKEIDHARQRVALDDGGDGEWRNNPLAGG